MKEHRTASTTPHPGCLQLGALSIDPAAGDLFGPGGRERLDPKVMDVLAALAGRADELVTREELMAAVWPGAVVTDDVLRRCIYQLRAHLARAGGDERYKGMLETLPKRGYRLHRAFEEPGSAPGAAARSPHRRLALVASVVTAAAVAAVLWWAIAGHKESASGSATPSSIAVLAFDDLSETQDQRYFADGLAEDILNVLARLPELRVIARTSSFSYRDRSQMDIRTIGRQLNVSHLLEGSVRKAGDRVRVTAQLIRVADGSHLWSRSYDRKAGELLELQREIAGEIARALEIRLTDGSLRTAVQAVDPMAHDHYLHARYLYSRRSPGDLATAVQYLERAVDLDPKHAQAWALLSGITHIRVFDEGTDPASSLERMRIAIARALALAPESGQVHARAAQYYRAIGDAASERAHWERAVALEPNNWLVVAFSAGLANDRGDFDEALRHARRAVALDPVGAVNRFNLSAHLENVGQIDDAWRVFQRAREPDGVGMAEREAELLELLGRHEEAFAAAGKLPDGAIKSQLLALALHGLGREVESQAAMGRLRAGGGPEHALALAKTHAWRGEPDRAFEWLDRAARESAEQAPMPGFRRRTPNLIASGFLTPLYDDPRLRRYFAP